MFASDACPGPESPRQCVGGQGSWLSGTWLPPPIVPLPVGCGSGGLRFPPGWVVWGLVGWQVDILGKRDFCLNPFLHGVSSFCLFVSPALAENFPDIDRLISLNAFTCCELYSYMWGFWLYLFSRHNGTGRRHCGLLTSAWKYCFLKDGLCKVLDVRCPSHEGNTLAHIFLCCSGASTILLQH